MERGFSVVRGATVERASVVQTSEGKIAGAFASHTFLPMHPLHALAALALATTAAAAADTAMAPTSRHPAPSGVSARRCGSALYACTPHRDGPALPSVCVNLCVKGAEPPKQPLPEGVCGPPCTDPAEACVLAATAAAASVGTGGGGGGQSQTADATPVADAPLTHADFEVVFAGVRGGAEACPLVVS